VFYRISVRHYILTKRDVVFNNTNSEEWVGKTAVFDRDGEYVFSNHMTRLRADKALIHADYLAGYLHLLWSMGYSRTRAKRWVSQAGIESSALASFKLPLPTLPEQQRIVDVLRQAEVVSELRNQFDKLIPRIKRQLFVEMFGDPNPRHNKAWPVVKLGSAVTVATGGTPSREKADGYGGSIAWAKSTDLTDEAISSTEERLSESGLRHSNAKVYPRNTILLAMYGQGQTRGRTAKLLIEASCNQACAALLPSEDLLPDYLWVWLQLSYDAVRSLGRGGQQENLNLDIVRNLSLPKPPFPLQQEFSRRLDQLLAIENAGKAARKQAGTMLSALKVEALTGIATEAWRARHSEKIALATQVRDVLLRERGTKPVIRPVESALIRVIDDEPQIAHRSWLLAELSDFQRAVLEAFLAYPVQPLLAEVQDEFDGFRESEVLAEKLATFQTISPDQLHRTLGQLAALGLIAKVSVTRTDPSTRAQQYLTAFRPLHPTDQTRAADVAVLRVALDQGVKPEGAP
jgi:type I restriction enzyme S subunit